MAVLVLTQDPDQGTHFPEPLSPRLSSGGSDLSSHSQVGEGLKAEEEGEPLASVPGISGPWNE